MALQEPYFDHLRNTRAGSNWTVVYPPGHKDSERAPRSVLLINNWTMSSDGWEPLPMASTDVTAVCITANDEKLYLFNVYNDQKHSETLRLLEAETKKYMTARGPRSKTHILWLGDFNRHSPAWDEPRNSHLFTAANLSAANQLIQMTSHLDLLMIPPRYLPTLCASRTKNETRPDNIFCSSTLADNVIHCSSHPELRPACTHRNPIVTALDFVTTASIQGVRYNFRRVDWGTLRKGLTERLLNIEPPQALRDIGHMKQKLQVITDLITDLIEKHVPKVRPSPHARRWWTDELANTRREVNRLGRLSKQHRGEVDHPSHAALRMLRNRYKENIEKQKHRHWLQFVEDIDPDSIWLANRYISHEPSDATRARVPTLQADIGNGVEDLTENSQKGKGFFGGFFIPPPPTHILNIDPTTECPETAFKWRAITDAQIKRVIGRLAPYKAPGPNGVVNIFYKETCDLLTPHLRPIFRSTFSLRYYPDEWKVSRTIVLRKPSRPDYRATKAYRPIALLDTLSKILSACVAESLVYGAEKHDLLPPTQFGGRPGRTTTDALHLLVDRIKSAWRRGNVMSIMFLDIKSAFPSVVPERLIHDMRMKGVPVELTDWIQRKLAGRTTTIAFNDYTSEPYAIPSRLDQGCPLSVVFHHFYNAHMTELAHPKSGEGTSGFVDDSTLLAEAKSFEETHRMLDNMMTRPSGAIVYAREHNVHFELTKTAVLDLTRRRERAHGQGTRTLPLKRPIATIAGQLIRPLASHKYVGVILDQELRFKEHAAYALGKGQF